ncbi:MAG: M28 family peptidase, partial [Actinomycetota bacterium]
MTAIAVSPAIHRALVSAAALVLVVATATFVLASPPGKERPTTGPLQPDLEQLKWEPLPDLADLSNWETYNAYNVVHFVSHNLTNRQPNDTTSDDPPGDGPACMLKGDIAAETCMYNHQLEYLAWWEEALTGVLKDFGVTFRTYEFESPGGTLANFATNAGHAINKLAIIPGADHPEDLVVIGSHYDQVDGSPYAAWDQTAGTGVLMRTARMLADYWRETGTRPSATYVFAAWDAEEAGGHGSKLYVGTKNNRTSEDGNLPKDPEVTLTAYLNHDPCGAHYPAMYRGLPASRNPLVEKTGFIPMNIALHEPAGSASETERMAAFNEFILAAIHDLFDYIDDTLPIT